MQRISTGKEHLWKLFPIDRYRSDGPLATKDKSREYASVKNEMFVVCGVDKKLNFSFEFILVRIRASRDFLLYPIKASKEIYWRLLIVYRWLLQPCRCALKL